MRGDRLQLQSVGLNLMPNRRAAMREPHTRPRTPIIRRAIDGGAALGVAVQDSRSRIAERYPRLQVTLPVEVEGAQ